MNDKGIASRLLGRTVAPWLDWLAFVMVVVGGSLVIGWTADKIVRLLKVFHGENES